MHRMKALPVRRLSSILSFVANELRDRFGLTRLYIGGASAPAMLDHLFAGNAQRMRDLDLILLAGRPVDEDLARSIGQALDGALLRFLPRYVYPRLRSRDEKTLWTAGWGLIWDSDGVEVDLSIFPDLLTLDYNGLMNIDRVLIPFSAETSLNETGARMLTAGSAEGALEAGLFADACGGYYSWVHRAPVIVAWNALHASPIECAIRIVRACANKLAINQLHPELADPLRSAIIQGHDSGDRFLRVRNLVKLFHDDCAGTELEMLHALGAFKYWLPEIGQTIDKLGPGGLTAVMARAEREGRLDHQFHAAFVEAGEQGGDDMSILRLDALLLKMPPARRERVLLEIAVAEPLFATLVRARLGRFARRSSRSAPRLVSEKLLRA
jgi:hypothetical protein